MPTQELSRRSIELLECKVGPTSDQYGTLEGYASVKNTVDAWGDTIIDGAYNELDALLKDGFVTFGHENSDLAIGDLLECREDTKGLWVKMRFYDTAEAQDVRKVCVARIASGKSVGLSIDYYTQEWEWKQTDQNAEPVRILKKIKVVGFAIVNVPAERQAEAVSVKSGPGRPNEEQYKSLLAELEDWTGREEWISENRKQGLSQTHKDRITAIKSRLEALLETPADTPDDEVPLGVIYEIEQFAASL